MDDFGLISRQTEGKHSLLDRKTQEKYYQEIQQDPSILKFRKLREGIYSSNRRDEFAYSVYCASVELSLQVQDFNELLKSLIFLSLQKGPRYSEMMSLLLLYQACFHQDSLICGNVSEFLRLYNCVDVQERNSTYIRTSYGVFMALYNDIDYNSFIDCFRNATSQQKIIIQQIIPRYRKRVYEMFQKSFYTYPKRSMMEILLFDTENEWAEFVQHPMQDPVVLKYRKGK